MFASLDNRAIVALVLMALAAGLIGAAASYIRSSLVGIGMAVIGATVVTVAAILVGLLPNGSWIWAFGISYGLALYGFLRRKAG